MTRGDQRRWPPDEGVTDPVEQRAIWKQFVPVGWHGIYDDLMLKLEAIVPGFFLSGAKERFGGMRVGVRGRLGEKHAVICLRLDAEQLSYRTCAICGAPGRLCVDARGWFQTVCSHHASGFKPYVADILDEGKGKQPMVKIVAVPRSRFKFGVLKGQIAGLGPDFFEPLEDDELSHWEGGSE